MTEVLLDEGVHAAPGPRPDPGRRRRGIPGRPGRRPQKHFVQNTPLWFYILREAELNGGRLTGVGGRVVAEVFHRAMEGIRASIVKDPGWRPSLGPDSSTFRMTDLLLLAFENNKELLAPLG